MNKRITMFISLILVLGGGITLPSTSSWAADIFFYPQAGATRYYLNQELMSECSGKPTTPQCALDTWQSCLVLQRIDQCQAIGIEGMVFLDSAKAAEKQKSSNTHLYAYRPMRKVIISDEDLPPNSLRSKWLRSGDVEIEYFFDVCDGEKPSDCKWKEHGQENVFLRRQSNGLWHVFAWSNEAGYVVCEGFEPPLGKHCSLWLEDPAYIDYVLNIDPDRNIGAREFKRIDPAPFLELGRQ